MRKLSKILTVLLTFALLCGVFVSVLASAEEVTHPLNATGNSPLYNDFDGGKSSYGGATGASSGPNLKPMKISTVDGHLRIYRDNSVADSDINTSGAAPTYSISQLSYSKNPLGYDSGNITTSDYVVVDFDFGSDRYKYSYPVVNDNGTPDDKSDDTEDIAWKTVDSLEDVPAEYADTATIAYVPMSFTLGARTILDIDIDTFATALWQESNYTFLNLKQDSDGKWGIYDKNSKFLYQLSNEVGVYDHFSYVVVLKERTPATDGGHAGYSAEAFFYANGEYLTSVDAIGYFDKDTDGDKVKEKGYAEAICLQRLYFSITAANKVIDGYSFAIDNVAVNYYDKGYTSVEKYGVDDLVKDGVSKNNLAACDDVVFTTDYVIPGKPYAVTINGKSYYSFALASADMKNGDTIVLNDSVTDFTPAGSLTNFTIVCAEGKTFSLSANAAKYYDVIKNGNEYTVIINEDALDNRELLNVTGHENNNYDNFSTTTQEGGNHGTFGKNNSTAANTVDTVGAVGTNGNNYWHYVNNGKEKSNTSGAEMQWRYSKYNLNDLSFFDEDYADYFTIDFDFGSDRYVYTDGDGVYHTAASLDDIPEAFRDTAETAFMNGKQVFGLQFRLQYVSGTAVKFKELNAGYPYSVQDVNGDWYLSTDSTYSSNDIKISGVVGEFDHITYVVKINRATSSGAHADDNGVYAASGEYENLNATTFYLFVNGEYLTSGKLWSTSYSNMKLQALKSTFADGDKEKDKYAYAFDNCALNWYSKGYESTGYGLDDFITSGDYATKPIYECSDVLYTEEYISSMGYVSVDGGKSLVFLEGKIDAELAKIADGATVITSRDVYDFTPAKGVKSFTVELVRGAKFTLSADAKANLWVIEAKDADTITVKQLDTSSALTVNFLDQNGKVFKTKYLLPGMTLTTDDVTAKAQNLYDVKASTVKSVTSWKLNLASGDVEANGYKLESLEGMPEVVTVTPTLTTVGTLKTYAIYYVDEDGLTKLYGDYDSYPTTEEFFDSSITAVNNVIKGSVVDALKNSVVAAPDGATLVLLYEGSADLGNKYGITASANKTLNVDINGRTLIHSYGATSQWANQIFIVSEGATFNLYSSKEGGAIYEARYKTSFGSVFAQGVIFINTATEATVNVDGTNLSVYGGTLVTVGTSITYAESAKVTDPETGAEKTVYNPITGADARIAARKASVGDGKQITVNVNGGYYYHGLRSAYALFTVNCPDVYINVDGAKIVNTHTTYAIYHDYSDSTTIFYGAQSTVNFKNSEIICMNDEGTALTTFAYRMGAIEVEEDKFVATTISLENCKLIGKVGSMASDARLIIGAGCEVSGISLDSKVVVKDGVDFARSTVDTLSATVSYPKIFASASATPAPVLKVGETDVWYLNPEFYNGTSLWAVNVTKSYVGFITTVAADVAEAKTITWLDSKGEVFTTEKWFEGSKVASKKSPELIDGNWYDVQYKYDAITVTDNATLTPVVGDMVTNGEVAGKLANATLSSGMALNIYLPKGDGVTITEVKVGDQVLPVTEVTLIVEGVSTDYYMFSWASAAADFSVATATISYSVNSEEYGYVNKTATATVELDVVLYATIVSDTYPHESEEAVLIVTMMEYKRAVARAIAAATETTYEDTEPTKEFFASHNNCLCSEYVSIEYPEEEYNDISDLEEAGIEGATFTLDSAGAISLVFTADSADLEITVKYSDLRRVYTLTAKYNEDAECYITPGVPAAYIDNVFTISVGDAVGVYSLAAYLDEAEDDDAIMVAEALYKYAVAAENYKYITVEEAK